METGGGMYSSEFSRESKLGKQPAMFNGAVYDIARILGPPSWVQCHGRRTPHRARILDPGSKVPDAGCRMQELGLRILDVG